MIIDCFIFYNELKLLDFRLEYLYDHVDYFVLVEATHTFVGNPKPLYFKTNKDRYAKYLDKIIYVKVKDMPNTSNPWDNEIHQRNCIKRGLDTIQSSTTLSKDDKIVIGDLDEIPDAEMLKIVDSQCYNLMMRQYFYDIEHFYDNVIWKASKLVNAEILQTKTIQEIRDTMFFDYITCGWHLTYFGNAEFITNKLANFSHQNYNTPEFNTEYILKCLNDKENPFKTKKRTIGYTNIKYNNYLPIITSIGKDNTNKKLLDLHNNDIV